MKVSDTSTINKDMTVLQAMELRQALQNTVEREVSSFVRATGLPVDLTASGGYNAESQVNLMCSVSVYMPE